MTKKEQREANRQRQEALRLRRAQLGLFEVRGLWAPIAMHAAIKRKMRKLVEDQHL